MIITTKLQARFDGKVLVPMTPVSLPTGEILDVEVRGREHSGAGDPQEILRVLRNLAIEEAKLPVRHQGIFDDEK